MQLSVKWARKNDNDTTDELSQVEDVSDHMLDLKSFHYFDKLWGPLTINRFPSVKTKQVLQSIS